MQRQEAVGPDTIKSYLKYISLYPDGKFVEEAEKRISELRRDLGVYEKAINENTESALKAFLDGYPGHEKEAAAQSVLETNIFYLLSINNSV